ncbi:MAG: CHAD domain-containing protein [Gemmataceae bacterium]|nr:CHAD domain-containing protein [Gemmataceae bacterium]
MKDGKWIDGLTAGTPLLKAARRVLEVRLGLVRHCLPPALHQASEDVEHVHRLRVATRRARAALDMFASCVPDDTYAATKKQLRRIRRAAGAARDWDVFITFVARARLRWSAPQVPGREFILGYALAQRRAAHQGLQRLDHDYPARFERLQNEVLAAATDGGAPRALGELAQALIADLLRQLERDMAGNLDDYGQLHQVRIAGKRLRYAMEIFAGCFRANFRDTFYPVVENMQDILGAANDSHVASGYLEDMRAALAYLPPAAARRVRPGIEHLRGFHDKRLVRQRSLFAAWQKQWPKQRDAAGFATSVVSLVGKQ